MKIEIAKHERMSQSGSSLLRLIQNFDMPLLDLLIREAIQNSLDASLEGNGHINVDFNIKQFESKALSEKLEGITESLNRKYPSDVYKLLEIRDSNTTGLTGPMHHHKVKNNDFGNLLKLVYEISKPQNREGAGGSWGLGKTVYFRIGIGLVIYYSRIQCDNGGYESRLAACLVENETAPNSLIKSNDGKSRGICWWGQEVAPNATIAIIDEDEINTILDILGVKPYLNHETGTDIIIPYISEEKLLTGILPISGDEEDTKDHVWWTDKLEDYLLVGIQRWYAPRLMNENFKNGRWLRVRINGKGIQKDSMAPLFKVIQGLYNFAPLCDAQGKGESGSGWVNNIIVKKIELRNTFLEGDACSGYVSFVKVNRDDLLMSPPNNCLSPYIYINEFDYNSENNYPIVMYTRKPGMIVGFELINNWSESINIAKDEFLIGLFVLNSSKVLKYNQIALEEYIRGSEKADHTSWTDWNLGSYKPSIITKIQTQTRNKILAEYKNSSNEGVSQRRIGLGKALAEILLPPENFGKNSTLPVKANPKGGGSSSRKGLGLYYKGQPRFYDGQIDIDFELRCGHKAKIYMLELIVKLESGIILANDWEAQDVVGTSFPLFIRKLEIHEYKKERQNYSSKVKGLIIKESITIAESNSIKLEMLFTDKHRIPFGGIITVLDSSDYVLYGTISFYSSDTKLEANLSISQAGGNK